MVKTMENNYKCDVEKDILWYAFRYALGRMTFAPITVIDNIKRNAHCFEKGDYKRFIKEIKNMDEMSDKALGHQCDKETWYNFVKYCEEKLREGVITL